MSKPAGRKFSVWGMAAAVVAVLIGILLTSGSHAAEVARSVSGTATCQVDSQGYCTLNHPLGVVPTAAEFQPALIGQLATSDPSRRTATTVQPRFFWHTGALFAAGTSITYSYIITTDATANPPSSTPVSSPPVSTPPVSTPPTTTTPAPTTPTGTVSPVKTCTSSTPGWFTTTSTNNQGDGRTYGEYFVHNNMWNNSNGIYTLSACNYDNWYEEATQPLPGDRGVQAYPNVHKDYNDVAVFNADGTPKIRSAKFAAKTPTCAGCIYNVAFDAWLGQGLNNELMIWTENKGQVPAGSKVATVTFAGQTYDVWHESGYTAYVSQTTQKYGTMPLGLVLKDMSTRGWMPTKTTWQVDFGIEIVSTAGLKQRFDFTDFSIDDDY